jgi:hypothetical protein
MPWDDAEQRERTMAHEAAHAAMALTVGLPIEIIRCEYGTAHVAYRYADTYENAERFFLCTLAPIITEAVTSADFPAWPLNPYDGPPHQRHDRAQLRATADRLNLDAAGYRDLRIKALRIMSEPEYERLMVAITGTLDWTPCIDRDLLSRVTRRHGAIATEE